MIISIAAVVLLVASPASAAAPPSPSSPRPAGVVVHGSLLEVVTEAGRAHSTHSSHLAGLAPSRPAPVEAAQVSWLLMGDDGSLVPVEGLSSLVRSAGEGERLTTGQEVLVEVDLPEVLAATLAMEVGQRAVRQARGRPAAPRSVLTSEATDLARQLDLALPVRAAGLQVQQQPPGAPGLGARNAVASASAGEAWLPHEVVVAVVDVGPGDERVPTDADVASMITDASRFWAEQTGGKVTFELDGLPVRWDREQGCADMDALWADAVERTGFQLTLRRHLVIVPLDEPAPGCGYGTATVGHAAEAGGIAQLENTYDLALTAHELGHNISLQHASAMECDSSPRQDFTSPDAWPRTPCRAQEYGDALDVMAGAWVFPGNLSSAARLRLGVVDPTEHAVITTTGVTDVDLASLSAPTGPGRTVVTVIDPRTDVTYHLENRQISGRDEGRLSVWGARPGLRVLRDLPDGQTLALDATATARPSFSVDLDRALPAGEVFSTAGDGIRIRTTQHRDGSLTAHISTAAPGQAHPAVPVGTCPALDRPRTAG